MGRAFGEADSKSCGDPDEISGIGSVAKSRNNRELGLVIYEQQPRGIKFTDRLGIERCGDFCRRSEIHIAASKLLKSKLRSRADDVMGTTDAPEHAIFVFRSERPT